MGRGRRKRCSQGGPQTAEGVLAGARAERTLNMLVMAVTLDVSKLSGWLNAAAFCRVEREAFGKRGGMRGRATGEARVGRRRRKKCVCREEPSCGGCAGRARAERT